MIREIPIAVVLIFLAVFLGVVSFMAGYVFGKYEIIKKYNKQDNKQEGEPDDE